VSNPVFVILRARIQFETNISGIEHIQVDIAIARGKRQIREALSL